MTMDKNTEQSFQPANSYPSHRSKQKKSSSLLNTIRRKVLAMVDIVWTEFVKCKERSLYLRNLFINM